jgi:hypothetical protein
MIRTQAVAVAIVALVIAASWTANAQGQGAWKAGIELMDGKFHPGVSAERCLGDPGNPCPAIYDLSIRNRNPQHLDVIILCLAHDRNKRPFASGTAHVIALEPMETRQDHVSFDDILGPADAARVAGVICEAQLWDVVPPPSSTGCPEWSKRGGKCPPDDLYGLRRVIDKKGHQCPPGYGEVTPAPGVPKNTLIGPGYCGPLPGTKHQARPKPNRGCLERGPFDIPEIASGEYCLWERP